ncbi:MAG TPA: DEAD/DEAH box helicase family protein, partial [Lysobacter sp.]
MTIRLRPYQQLALDCLWAYLRAADGNPALVLPTGAGKSPLMAAIAAEAVQNWGGRVGILAHVQELVEQNAAKLRAYWPDAPMGIYAAALRKRDRFDKILMMQIQSVWDKADQLGWFDILAIDEAHRIPLDGEGRYLSFIAACRKINPNLRVVGLTATPYRLQGAAVPVCGAEHILTEIAYEARVGDLIADGYLSRLTTPGNLERPDFSSVKVKRGEYDDKAQAVAAMPLVERTVDDLLARSVGRRCGVVFCINTEHSKAVMAALHARGETATMIFDGMTKTARLDAIEGHKSGLYRWMVNVNIASEGYDNPIIDVVAMLRATKSPGLMYQQIGRGFRLAPGKTDCLVLDYAGNILEHGPVDKIRVRSARPGKAATVETARVKECPACPAILAIGVRECPECGYSFASTAPAHLDRPVDAPVLSVDRARVVNTHAVHSVKYERGIGKAGKPDHLRAIYQCGLRRFTDFVCLQHSGMARANAIRWWQERDSEGPIPRTVEEALERAYGLPTPSAITVDETEKYPRVVSYEWNES